jgi:threonine dehydrogenase-like Zn-dependent dehydrogenase
MKVPSFIGGGKITTVEKAVPQPASGQLLIQCKANALCGSERHQFYNGSDATPGHETAGIVVAAGPDTSIPIGTRGVVFLMDFCGKCKNCKRGATNQCLNKRGDMGFNQDGGYGVYELIHENIFYPIDDDLSLTDATMLLDVMGTNGHAINLAQLVCPNIESMIIMGAGPIGLGMLAMAKIMLGQHVPIFISDIMQWRLNFAEKMGGLPINISDETLKDGLTYHGLQAVDVAMDTSGKAVAREGAMQVLNKKGVLVCIGHGEQLTLNVSRDLIVPERAVLGSEYFRFDEFAANQELLHQHRDYLQQIITHRFGIGEIQTAFELFFKGETGKVIIEQ